MTATFPDIGSSALLPQRHFRVFAMLHEETSTLTSMAAVPQRFRPVIEDVVRRVAAGDYVGLKRDGIDPHPDGDLSLWIREYGDGGATLVPLPDEAWDSAEAIRAEDEPETWFVVVDLWTVEEGRSDLSLEATVRETGDRINLTIEDLHVH